MNIGVEPMQQPIRKLVGRPPTLSRRLAHLEELAASRVDFAVVGGLAVILNGCPRLLLDAGILVHDAPDNLRRLLDVPSFVL